MLKKSGQDVLNRVLSYSYYHLGYKGYLSYSEHVWILNQMLTSSAIEEAQHILKKFGRDVVIFKKIQYSFVIDMPFSVVFFLV